MKIIFLLLAIALTSCTQTSGVAPSIELASEAPTSLVATPGNAIVSLAWSAPSSGISSINYTVMRSLTAGGPYADVAGCIGLAITACTDSTVTNGTLYYYVVKANNVIGSSPNSNEASTTPSSSSNAPGSLTYTNSAPTYTQNTAISNNSPVVTGGGPITSWSITPNLNTNTGLTFNTSTGVISGTPTTISDPGVTYTVTATNGDGTSTFNITIRVIVGGVAPTISYSGTYTYQAGQTVSPPISPTLGGGTPTSCTSSPALPAGFLLNATTCVISGQPTATAAQQLFTITATNAAGSGAGTVNIGVLAAGANNIALTGVSSFTTAACALFNLTVRDAFGNANAVAANTTFNLSGAGSNGAFYSDAGCSSAITSVVIPNGSSTVPVYYRKTSSGSTTLTAALSTPVSPALGSANRSVTVSTSTAAKYGVVLPPTGTTVSCNAVTINVLDSSDNSVNTVSARTVTLSGTGSPTFYSDSGCTSTASTVVVSAGANTATAYMRKVSVGSSTVTAASSGMASGSGSITISVAPAQRITFSSPPAVPYAASTCQTYNLLSRDSLNNNTVAVTADTTVTLSGVADGSFYSNSTCTAGNEITNTVITNGTSARAVYFSKPTTTASTPGSNITLTAAVSGWTPNATTSVSVSSGAPTNLGTNSAAVGLAVSSATAVANAGKCVSTTLRVNDETNTLVPTSRVTSTITTTLSGGGPGAQFWSNSTCTTPISTVTINPGQNTGSFFYSSTTTTSVVPITWTNGGLPGSSPGTRNVTVTSGVPSRIAWTANPSSFNTNTCQTYAFNVRDPNTVTQISTTVSSATDFALADGSDGTFYSTAGCSNVITSVTVASGASQSPNFYYRKGTTTPPAATISVTLQNPMSPAITTLNQAITVTAPPLVPNNVLISAAPATGLVATQSCSLLTLQSRNNTTNANVTSNSTFTLAGTNGATFYYDSGCTAIASPTTMTIANGTSSVSSLYVRTANTGSVTISGTGPLTVNSLALAYSAPAPTMLALAGPILMNTGSSCGNYIITTQDGAGIDRNVAANTTITVASTGAAPLQFYSDASCSMPLSGNQVVVGSGTSTANFYASGSSAGSATIQVSGGGLTQASQAVTMQ